MILLLALALFPMATFGADCCPDAESGAVDVADHVAAAAAPMADCHEPAEPSATHTGCDAECAARCATPSMFPALALWSAQVHAHQPRSPWHAGIAPHPQGARLLRPPIHA